MQSLLSVMQLFYLQVMPPIVLSGSIQKQASGVAPPITKIFPGGSTTLTFNRGQILG